jgi:hypothetical protein
VTDSDTIKDVEPAPITATVALHTAGEVLRNIANLPFGASPDSAVAVAEAWMHLAQLLDAMAPVEVPESQVGFR